MLFAIGNNPVLMNYYFFLAITMVVIVVSIHQFCTGHKRVGLWLAAFSSVLIVLLYVLVPLKVDYIPQIWMIGIEALAIAYAITAFGTYRKGTDFFYTSRKKLR